MFRTTPNRESQQGKGRFRSTSRVLVWNKCSYIVWRLEADAVVIGKTIIAYARLVWPLLGQCDAYGTSLARSHRRNEASSFPSHPPA